MPSGWSSANPSKLTSIPQRLDFSRDIGIFTIPKRKYDCLRRSPNEQSMLSVLDSLFDRHFRDTYQYLGFHTNEPGLPTSTQDLTLTIPLFIGIHLDSWDESRIPRSARRNRFKVNTGTETRYFIFHPKPIHQITEFSELGSKVGRTEIRSYLKNNSILYKLAVRPGEGYLAPTENLLHDATTLGMKEPDRGVTALGLFYPLEHFRVCSAIRVDDPEDAGTAAERD